MKTAERPRLKTGPTGVRFASYEDAEKGRNPIRKGQTGWRKAQFAEYIVRVDDVALIETRTSIPDFKITAL